MIVTWKPSFSTNIAYTNGDLTGTATLSNAFRGVKANVIRRVGRYYHEIVPTTGGLATLGIGICNGNWPNNFYSGQGPFGIGWFGTGGVFRNAFSTNAGGNWSSGDTIGCLTDLGAQTISYYLNNTLKYSGLDISPVILNNPRISPCANTFASGDVIEAHFAAASWTFPAPAGAIAWSVDQFDPAGMMFLLSP